MEAIEMGMLNKLEAIEEWQNNSLIPLTCGNDPNHSKLQGKIIPTGNIVYVSGNTGGEVVLYCPDCDYIQEHIPDDVYESYFQTHLTHKISLGQIVESEVEEEMGYKGKVKGIVVGHSRDCDGTPLYILSDLAVRYNPYHDILERLEYKKWAGFVTGGFSERSLRVCEGEFEALQFDNIYDYERDMLGS